MSSIIAIKALVNSYKQPILVMNENGIVLDCNKLFLDFYSIELEDIINLNYFSYFKKNSIVVPGDSIHQLLNQKSQAITFHRVDEKRFLKYLQWTLFEYKLDCEPRVYVLLAHDVTPILEVATKEQLLIDSLIDSLPAEIFWKDKSLVFLGCNKSFLKSHNLKDKSEIIGKTDFDLAIDNNDSNSYRSDDMQIIRSQKAKLDIIERRLFHDGTEKYLSTSKVPLFDDQGELYGILGICLDITAHKFAEEKLKEAFALAEQANYTKSEFIANMSHDIRTPLSGVVGGSQLLMDVLTDPEHKQQARWIYECAVQLLELLNDILTVIAIDEDKTQVQERKEIFSIRQCIDDLVSLERPSTLIKGISLQINVDEDLPKYFYGDSSALYRILLNLLGNAIKFTNVGVVTVEVKILEISDFKARLQFIVKDTGIGIPKDLHDKIFDRFYKANPSYKGVYTGHGIGLHIAKTFVNRMGGALEFNSEVGVGTSFFFDLEFTIAEDQTSSIDLQNVSIEHDVAKINTTKTNVLPVVLMVEDNYVALKILESIAKLANINYVSAKDGESAFDILIRQNFNLIITDIGLPGISGKDLTKKIREWEKINGRPATPIVGLTAHGRDQILDECLALGMNDVYSKPIDINTFKEITSII